MAIKIMAPQPRSCIDLQIRVRCFFDVPDYLAVWNKTMQHFLLYRPTKGKQNCFVCSERLSFVSRDFPLFIAWVVWFCGAMLTEQLERQNLKSFRQRDMTCSYTLHLLIIKHLHKGCTKRAMKGASALFSIGNRSCVGTVFVTIEYLFTEWVCRVFSRIRVCESKLVSP